MIHLLVWYTDWNFRSKFVLASGNRYVYHCNFNGPSSLRYEALASGAAGTDKARGEHITSLECQAIQARRVLQEMMLCWCQVRKMGSFWIFSILVFLGPGVQPKGAWADICWAFVNCPNTQDEPLVDFDRKRAQGLLPPAKQVRFIPRLFPKRLKDFCILCQSKQLQVVHSCVLSC